MTHAVAALVVALAVAAGAADEPRARKLDEGGGAEVPADAYGEPGRPLPRTLAICRDAATRRCWTAPREPDCAPAGTAYRVIIDERDDVAEALAGCRENPPR